MHDINNDYFFHDYFLTRPLFLFLGFVLQRNRQTKSVALDEENSILLL